MHLVVCGVTHHTTSVDIRERISAGTGSSVEALQKLASNDGLAELAVLSTCNRFEIYAVAESAAAALTYIHMYLEQSAGVKVNCPLKLIDDDAVLHLMRVASGLDSMIIGEGQILRQIKRALSEASSERTAGPNLQRAFQLALSCGKKVRSTYPLAHKAVSVPSAAIELAQEFFGTLNNKRIVMVGAGEVAHLCLKQILKTAPTAQVVLYNRSESGLAACKHAFPQISKFTSERLDLPALVADADLVFVATGAHDYLVRSEHVSCGPKLIIDLSVPRNVHPAVGAIDGVVLRNVDHLQVAVEKNLETRRQIAELAEPILAQSLAEFQEWRQAAQLAPHLKRFRQSVFSLAELAAGKNGSQTKVCTRLADEILHLPTVRLKKSGNVEVAEAVAKLFG